MTRFTLRSPLLSLALLITACAPASPPAVDDAPFATLRQAYATRDAALAASAYTPDAVVTYAYSEPHDVFRGTQEIEASFRSFFENVDSGLVIDLNFRAESLYVRGDTVWQSGIYRLQLGAGGTSYGRFLVSRGVATVKSTLFTTDRSEYSSQEAFEQSSGQVMFEIAKLP